MFYLTVVITAVVAFYKTHFLAIHAGAFVSKIKASLAIGVSVSPFAFYFAKMDEWLEHVALYMSIICVALILDLIIGVYVHLLFFKDFEVKKMVWKFLEKSGCTFIGLILFELFGLLFRHHNVEMGAYLELSIALTVLSYPLLSAFGNLSIITNGKFPPIGWVDKLRDFNKSGNIKDIIEQEQEQESISKEE